MKKIIAFIMIMTMTFGLVACGGKNNAATNTSSSASQEASKAPEASKPSEAPSATPESSSAPESSEPAIITPEYVKNSVGSTLWNAFLEGMKANEATTAEEMATVLSTNPIIQFMPMATPVEPGYLAGFKNDIKGFEKAAVYMPMMGSIAFAGYIFELADDADVNAFIKTLEDNADPAWNICVTADYILSGAYGNTVFFLMYQKTLDEAEAPADGGAAADAVIVEPEVEEGTWGETLWNAFTSNMNDNPSSTAVDAAFMLAMHESIPFMSGSSEIMPGFLAGFDNELSGFKTGAMFGPMIGSIAFVGYVFELEEGADIDAFIKTLTDESNPGWNICVTADQTVVGAYNNMVFFLMCPNSNKGE